MSETAIERATRFRRQDAALHCDLAILADAYVELLDSGKLASARAFSDRITRLSDLLEQALYMLDDECGDNFCAQVLVSEIESELNTTPKGGAK